MTRYTGVLFRLLKTMVKAPRSFARMVELMPSIFDSYEFSNAYTDLRKSADRTGRTPDNPLWEYFQNHREGPGIWKWEHYFEAYHRHLSRFVGKKVDVLEIGIYSGGSLPMWRSYFGEKSHVYGVDIEEACREYESDHVSVFIGDQADRNFWRTFKRKVEGVDVLIDDGGHSPEQQRITLEEMLPCIRPGGVYMCEDVHGCFNKFSAFATSLVHQLNHTSLLKNDPQCASSPPAPNAAGLRSGVSPFQSSIHSIHFYPYLVVIEKHGAPCERLSAPKHGTMWQPFL